MIWAKDFKGQSLKWETFGYSIKSVSNETGDTFVPQGDLAFDETAAVRTYGAVRDSLAQSPVDEKSMTMSRKLVVSYKNKANKRCRG